jgi:nitroimidazol reductase NimA-like FMN-containing flavoprotein (pyridoxamine 5'-phosphate oxidase superfamily)
MNDSTHELTAQAPAPAMPAHECWAAMRTGTLGRLGFSVDGEQEIFPLNYVIDQGTIVFRTSASSRIGLCLDGRGVAFEADGVADGLAWSVVVKGRAKAITGLYDSIAAAELPVHPLQPGQKPRLVRITADAVTGRRFPVADDSTWDTPITAARRAAPE